MGVQGSTMRFQLFVQNVLMICDGIVRSTGQGRLLVLQEIG